MTTGPVPTDILLASQVAELINGLVKALRAYHMYLPNNPIYQRASENLRIAFQPIWAVLDELPRFLEIINRARFLATDAGDDLLTLLWEQEFEFIQYQFVEFFGDGGGGMPEQTGSYATGSADAEAAAQDRRAAVAEEAPPRPKGVIDLDEFDSTLYFLDENEINQVAAAVAEEYQRDVRLPALSILFDLYELQSEEPVRSEILDVLESLFPSFLNARDFRTAAAVLRECRALIHRTQGLPPAHAARLDGFVAKLSEPAIVTQLVQSLAG